MTQLVRICDPTLSPAAVLAASRALPWAVEQVHPGSADAPPQVVWAISPRLWSPGAQSVRVGYVVHAETGIGYAIGPDAAAPHLEALGSHIPLVGWDELVARWRAAEETGRRCWLVRALQLGLAADAYAGGEPRMLAALTEALDPRAPTALALAGLAAAVELPWPALRPLAQGLLDADSVDTEVRVRAAAGLELGLWGGGVA